jgi:membrane-bound inhibitor of C-type lysozyme
MHIGRHAWLISLVLVAAPGCERGGGAPERNASAGGAAVTASTTTTQDAAPQPVRHWECDGGIELTTRYLPRDRAISLGLHEGERKLAQVASGSGEKYQEGPITFWSKGDTAIYERAPAPQIACRLASG